MKELLKVISKKLLLWSIVFNTISYFGTSPLTLDKIIKFTVAVVIAYLIMLITSKIASYIDNVNEVKSKTAIQKYYFEKVQSMTMEKIAETHTGYIHTLILEVSDLFMNLVWLFSISVLPLIIGTTSILLMVCKQSIITGIICLVIGFLAVYLKYKMMNKKQKYDKQVRKKKIKIQCNIYRFCSKYYNSKKIKHK